MKNQIVTSSKEIMGGTLVFAGTRVPVQTLMDYLKAGDSIDEFLEGFPTVSREQVVEFLDEAEKQISRRSNLKNHFTENFNGATVACASEL